MGNFVNLNSPDGFTLPVWLACPATAPRGAIVVLQEIFGVNDHIRAVAERYAAEGYLVVAPATFARVQPDVELGYKDADMATGMALKERVENLPGAGVLSDIQAAIDYAALEAGGSVGAAKVGIVGFCWGGLLAWRSACKLRGLAAAVCYYGGGMTTKPEDLKTILSIDKARWQQEMANREEHLNQFPNLPEAIWEAHRRVAADLENEEG